MGIFLAPNPINPDHLVSFAGPVSSFHYEVTPDFYRYTDQEWEHKFIDNQDVPSRPDWIAEYMAGEKGDAIPEGRKLAGVFSTETSTSPADFTNEIDYLLAFPNPTHGEMQLRFILNHKLPVKVELFDLSGRLISQPVNDVLMSAEHAFRFHYNKSNRSFLPNFEIIPY